MPRQRASVTYPGHRWGPLADDPWLELAPIGSGLIEAARAAWMHAGGTEETFAMLFPEWALANDTTFGLGR